MTGENTFGCYINGEPTIFGKSFLDVGGPMLEARWHKMHPEGDSLLFISASKNHQIYPLPEGKYISWEGMQIPVIAKGTGNTTILDLWKVMSRYFVDNNQQDSACEYHLDTTKSRFVNLVRFDTQERIASGTFGMTLYNSAKYNTTSCSDTLKITDGRFDVRYFPE